MAQIPFVGQSYADKPVSVQDTINWILEVSGDPQTKTGAYLRRTPGLKLFATPTTLGFGRGCHAPAIYRTRLSSTPKIYFVAGNTLYKSNGGGTVTAIGALDPGANFGRVYFADNGLQDNAGASASATKTLLLTDGNSAYSVDMNTDAAVTKITDTNFTSIISNPGPVVFNDGYFIVMDEGSQNCIVSPQYWTTGTAWSATTYFVVQSSPDNNTGMKVLKDQLWIYGTDTYEIYINTGATQVYEPLGGAANTIGTTAGESLASNGKANFWLGSNAQGENKVFMSQGFDAIPITTTPLEDEISGYSYTGDAIGYCYSYRGHDTYQISFPDADRTWCYDLHSQSWYRKTSVSNGTEHRHRTTHSESFFGKVIVQDWETGLLYEYDDDTYTDNGTEIVRTRVSPTMPSDNSRYFYPRFELLCRVGTGLASGTGSDPQVMLYISNDGGHNYGNELRRDMGVSGDYENRVIWNRLGTSRNRVWKVKISDPVDCSIYGATAEGVRVGR